jgi:hypothetical protein
VLKTINFKKVVFGSLVILIICFAYVYQKPMLRSAEAVDYTIMCLNNPPKEFGLKANKLNLNDITTGSLSIGTKSGFFNRLTNQRELSVTLHTKKGKEWTVRIDAYSGKCIEVIGALS